MFALIILYDFVLLVTICTEVGRKKARAAEELTRGRSRVETRSPRRSTYIHFNKFIKNLNKFIQLYTNVLKSRFWGYPPPLPKKIWLQFFAFRSNSPNFADWGSCMPLKSRLSAFNKNSNFDISKKHRGYIHERSLVTEKAGEIDRRCFAAFLSTHPSSLSHPDVTGMRL